MEKNKGLEKTNLNHRIALSEFIFQYPEICPQSWFLKIFIPVIKFFTFKKKLIQKPPTQILREFNNLGVYFRKIIHLSTHYTYTNSIYLYII